MNDNNNFQSKDIYDMKKLSILEKMIFKYKYIKELNIL